MTKFSTKSALFATALIAVQAVLMPATSPFGSQAQAQTIRHFPVNAVRGTIAFNAPPEIVLDGQTEHLSPGARIRDAHNMLTMTGALVGQEFTVNYRRENIGGMVSEVWLLTADEAAEASAVKRATAR